MALNLNSTQSKGPKPVLWSLCCLGEARFSLLIFIAGRKWVHMRVVEEGMVTVSPGEGLGPDAQVRVGNERGSLVLFVPRLEEHVEHAHSHPGQRHEVGEGLPHPS